MKKTLLIFLTLFIAIYCQAQQQDPTPVFEEDSHDFGSIKEENGPATFQFKFKNMGGTPLILKNVVASCGCTTPNWSREPVLPVERGFINVTYNPSGRPGHFEKDITVTSNGDPEKYILKIKGVIVCLRVCNIFKVGK